MENATTIYLTVDRSEEDASKGAITMFTTLTEAMGHMAEKEKCELYVVSEVVRLT